MRLEPDASKNARPVLRGLGRGNMPRLPDIPIYEVLEARGFEVCVVNARHFKNAPGRKSDIQDCQWLQELHSVGLLRGSFRPADEIVVLRAYLRHRRNWSRSERSTSSTCRRPCCR